MASSLIDWSARSLVFENGTILPKPGKLPRQPGTRFVVLVHGFANDRRTARSSFEAALSGLVLRSPASKLLFLESVWGFFWPSFVAKGPRLSDRVSRWLRLRHRHSEEDEEARKSVLLTPASYPDQVKKAVKVGRRLAAYLERLGQASRVRPEVILIGHSLGCRLILEGMRLVLRRRHAAANTYSVCLMAPAVPSYMLYSGWRLRRAFEVPRASRVLYSRNDAVLRWTFPPGQRRESGRMWPEALGLNGRPPVGTHRCDTGLGHTKYWSSQTTQPQLAKTLGLSVPTVLPRTAIPSQTLQLALPRPGSRLQVSDLPRRWSGSPY